MLSIVRDTVEEMRFAETSLTSELADEAVALEACKMSADGVFG
jgi:hypothetical protein